MEHVVTSAVVSFGALFPIVNPFGTIPIFLGMTDDVDDRGRQRLAARSAIFATVLLIVFFTLGSYLLTLFSVSLAAVETVGGLVIGFSGWQMLTEHEPSEPVHRIGDDDIAFYPMAFPLLAGPGALALSLGLTNRHDSVLDFLGWAIGITAIGVTSYVALRMASPVARRLGVQGLRVVGRVMGLLVLAIGAELVFHGIASEFGLEVAGH